MPKYSATIVYSGMLTVVSKMIAPQLFNVALASLSSSQQLTGNFNIMQVQIKLLLLVDSNWQHSQSSWIL